MDIVDLYFSEQEFSVEQDRAIAMVYELYAEYVEEQADRAEYERSLEI